jgi:hypothetical protein
MKLKFSDVSDLFVSPALWLFLFPSGYFGYLMLKRWSLRRGIRNIVPGKDAQKALSWTVITLSTIAVAFIFIVVPALYLALLSSVLLKGATPEPKFEYLTACHVSGAKLRITLMVKNHKDTAAALRPLFIDWRKAGRIAEKAYALDHGDIFWMSRRGLFFEPSEIRYYRLELPAPPNFVDELTCETRNDPPAKGFLPVKAAGDSHSVTASGS